MTYDRLPSILVLLENLPDEERQRIFEGIKEIYCHHCGTEQPFIKGTQVRSSCQCWNDE